MKGVADIFLRPFRLLAVALAGAVLAGCADGPGGAPQLPGGGAQAAVALLVPHAAQDARTRAVARSLENAARLAVADLKGVRIDLRVYPTDGTPGGAADAARRAADEGARILLGPLFADAARAAGAAVAPKGLNVLTFSNNPEAAGGNVFLLGTSFDATAARLVRYATAQGRNRFVIVHDETRSGEVGLGAARRAIAASGGTLAGTVSHPFTQEGVIAAIDRIEEVVQDTGANALVLTADAAGTLPLLTQILPENGVAPPEVQFIGLTRWDTPRQTLSLPGVQGGWFALPDPELAAAFGARYASAYGVAPHSLAALAYDGIAAIGALLAAGRGDAFGVDALTQPSGFAGANGPFRLRADGTSERALAVATIENSEVIILDPAPKRFDAAGF